MKDLENVKGIGEKTAKELEKDILFSDSAAGENKAGKEEKSNASDKVEKVDPSKKPK